MSSAELVPEFLAARGLVRQHVDSFDYFVEKSLRQIVCSSQNRKVTSDHSRTWRVEYLDVNVGSPEIIEEDGSVNSSVTPHECRLRDLTYSAPLVVKFRYYKGGKLYNTSQTIGRIPIMLCSSKCRLRDKSHEELASLQECPHDPGGYFIIKGAEKVVLIQEQLSKNRIILERDAKGLVCASVTSSTHERKSRCSVYLNSKGRLYLKHNSFAEDLPVVVVLKALGVVSDREIASLIGVVEGVTARALVASFEEAQSHDVVTSDRALDFIGKRIRVPRRSSHALGATFTLKEADEYRSRVLLAQTDAGERAAHSHEDANRRRIFTRADEARELLAHVVLGHVKVGMKHGVYDFRPKAFYVSYMVRRCLEASADESYLDDKDYYGNKRLELAGQLLALLFEDLFKRYNSELKRMADAYLARANNAEAFDALKHMRTDTISNGFVHALSTGNWSLRRFKMERAGVTQQLSRLSFMAALGHMTRVTSQFEKTRKVSGPRALQPSQWGMLCPSDTPEGESCGLVKNLSLLTHVTFDSENDSLLEAVVSKFGIRDVDVLRDACEIYAEQTYVVLLNGNVLGVTSEPLRLGKTLRKLRRRGDIDGMASVFVDSRRRLVNLATDGGRVCRPLIVCENGKSLLTPSKLAEFRAARVHPERNAFAELVKDGIVEYVDVNEANNTFVALREEHIVESTTHLEIDPLTVLGVVAGLIPYPHHNQSPRNTYQCAMGKQAIGTVGWNQQKRLDTLLFLNVYPQKPLVTTKTLEMINFDELPGGQNAIVAVMSYSGYDIEDAIVLNKASVDRGYGRCQVQRKYATTNTKYPSGRRDAFEMPQAFGESWKDVRRNSNVSGSDLTRGAQDFRRDEWEEKILKKLSALKKIPENEYESEDDEFIDPSSYTKNEYGETKLPSKTEKTLKPAPSRLDKFSALDPKDAIVEVGLRVSKGHVLANRHVPKNTAEISDDADLGYASAPSLFKTHTQAVIDQVCVSSNNANSERSIKILTREVRRPELGDKFSSRHGQKGVCGLIVPQRDVPFDKDGVCPDLIMNPHGFPSRMTVGKMIELVSGKAAVLDGKRRFGTAFAKSKQHAASLAGQALLENGYSYCGKDVLTSGLTGKPLKSYVFMGPVFYQKLKHMVVDKMHTRAKGPRVVLTRQPTEGRSRDGGLRLGEMERDCLIAYGTSNLLIERLMLSSDVFDAHVCDGCGLLSSPDRCSYCGKADPVAIKMPYAAKLLFQELTAMNIVPKLTVDARGRDRVRPPPPPASCALRRNASDDDDDDVVM